MTSIAISPVRSPCSRKSRAVQWDVLQVEPLLHRECAAISMRHCPSLRRDFSNGTLEIR
jgi:hypothetical protein